MEMLYLSLRIRKKRCLWVRRVLSWACLGPWVGGQVKWVFDVVGP
jgi:hypothetical protein